MGCGLSSTTATAAGSGGDTTKGVGCFQSARSQASATKATRSPQQLQGKGQASSASSPSVAAGAACCSASSLVSLPRCRSSTLLLPSSSSHLHQQQQPVVVDDAFPATSSFDDVLTVVTVTTPDDGSDDSGVGGCVRGPLTRTRTGGSGAAAGCRHLTSPLVVLPHDILPTTGPRAAAMFTMLCSPTRTLVSTSFSSLRSDLLSPPPGTMESDIDDDDQCGIGFGESALTPGVDDASE